ncbi:MAG TPA: hypothetical protein VGG75_03195 [Trebonia sp.]
MAWCAGYAIAAVVLYFCYRRLSGTQSVTADSSSIALQAWDMLHGNLLLHGWTVTDVSFWATELPEYMLVELIRGLSASDVHVAAALTYTLLTLLASLLAKGRATGADGLTRALIAAGIMIAPQLGGGTLLLLLGADHTGTGVPLMVTWLALDRAPRRWFTPPLIGLLLLWGLLGDPVVELLGVLPLALVCAIRLYRGIVRDREPLRQSSPGGATPRTPRSQPDGEANISGWLKLWWFELSLVGAAVVAFALNDLVVKLIAALGGFRVLPVNLRFAGATEMSGNLWRALDGVLTLYGADFFGKSWHASVLFQVVHVTGFALAVAAVWIAVRRFPWTAGPGADDLAAGDLADGGRGAGDRPARDLVTGVLVTGIGVNLAVFVFTTMPVSVWSAREIAGVLPAGAVLAGRLLAGPVLRARLYPLLAVAGMVYLIGLGTTMTAAQLPTEGQGLADWLVAHHLTNGLTGYGYGPSATLASGGRVELRQASFSPGRAAPGPEEYDLNWYDPSAHDASFLVLAARPGPFAQLTPAQARGIFGPPAHVYRVSGGFVVWTYRTNLLTRVR